MSRRHTRSSRSSEADIKHSTYGWTPYALILIALSVLCFIGASIQNAQSGKEQSFTFEPETAEQAATLEVKQPNTVYAVTVYQSTSSLAVNKGWSDVSVIVRSKKGEKLLSFGGDFWRASGYDGGHWSETKNRYTMKVAFPHHGDYEVSIESSSSSGSYDKPVNISFEPRRGSTIPLLLLGIPALIAGVIMGYVSNRHVVNEKLAEWSENTP